MEKLKRKAQTTLDKFYEVGIAIKGIDGAIELITGILLWISPQLLHTLLQAIASEAGESRFHVMRFVAEHIARTDADLVRSGLVGVIVFLLLHGIIKVGLVICLFKKWHWVYPWAIAVLGAFLVYQVYVFVKHPTIAMAVFSVLDAIIMWLVYKEYRELSRKAGRQ